MATILIVDDRSANRKILVTLLGHHGHRLLEAEDGREGLAAVHAAHPDLVITDVLMPVMDGYEFLRQLRLDPATRGIPVIFYTAHYGAREARELALASGAAYVLTKPADSQDVLRFVSWALSGGSEKGTPSDASPLTMAFDREHLRLVTDKLSEKAADLRAANARLRAVINIGLELASEQDADRLLQRVCVAALDLFGATYVTIGILDRDDRTVQRVVTSGADTARWIKTGDAVSGMLRTVIAERRPLRGDNPSGDPTALQLPRLHPEVHAFLAAPVASPAHVYGWICLVGNEQRSFTEDDEQLVMALSGQLGRIYENGYFAAVARTERDRAKRYLDTADVILLALDLDGRITLVNRYACALLGWTADELLGRYWVDTCLPARLRHALMDTRHKVLAGDLSVFESPVLAKSGEERLVEWRNTLLRDDAGHIIGTFSCGTDITERHQAADALRMAEERMRFAVQNANVGIWDMDPPKGAVRWSEILEAQYGLQPGTFAGTFEAFVEHIHPDDRTLVTETIGNAMRSGADFTVLNRTIWPDGTLRWLGGAGRFFLNEHGEPLRGVGISLDVTERRALEDQSLQGQKMEAVGRLAAGVAHDFNNLLTAILGYCELVLEDLAPDHPQRQDLTEIHKAGLRAAGLTRQLLAFSRKQVIEPTVLDLNALVSDMRAMLERIIREDVTIVLSLVSDLAPIKADRGQIEQIVMNLSVNARDAMPRGGTLTIGTANVELDEHYAKTHLTVTPGPYVALSVTDSGTGLSQEVRAHLFEPFFTTKEAGKGTGLGLATVHGIVARSGGSVSVHSELGKGTAFTVYFPRAETAEMIAETPAAPVTLMSTGAHTVLVVDDAEGLRQLAQRWLERQGYTVLVAASAGEARTVFDQNAAIDLILTDVVMPGGSGAELTRQLVSERPGLKVIYMSGYAEDVITHHGVLDPGIMFLQKPFTSETLGRKIREVLDGNPGWSRLPPAEA